MCPANLAVGNHPALATILPTSHPFWTVLLCYSVTAESGVGLHKESILAYADQHEHEGSTNPGHLLQSDTLGVVQADLLLYVVGRHQAPVDLQVDGHQQQILGKKIYLSKGAGCQSLLLTVAQSADTDQHQTLCDRPASSISSHRRNLWLKAAGGRSC